MPKPPKNGRSFSVGFTLIELVIVIVVIGILALLVAVNFSGIVMKSKKAGFNVSAQSVLRAMQVKEAGEEGFNPLSLNETNIQSALNITPNNFDSLTIYLYNNQDYVYIIGKNEYAGLTACGVRGSVSVELSEEASCALGGSAYTVAKVTDTTAGTFGGGDGSTCTLAMTIDSVEDLVALSNNVNGGNTYLNKCIKLAIDLDFNQSKSYVNPASTAYGDINGNAIIEGLKTELTTGAGFNPIGTSTNNFKGTLAGDLHNIYNLYINRPSTANIGLIGYNIGTITAVNLIAVSVVGQDNTGGICGMNIGGNVTEATVKGNVLGNNYVGLAVGYNNGDWTTSKAMSLIVEGNVTGNDYVGGLSGYNYASYGSGYLTGINKGGAINATGANVGRISGGTSTSTASTRFALHGGLAMSTVTVKGSTVTSNYNSDKNGSTISNFSEVTDNINMAELALDTYIGGDNDNNGYYWDYNASGVVELRKTADYPLTFSLSGAGTQASPYLISNYSDLRQASQKPSSWFKLTSNIDLTGQRYYMLGSYVNVFTGNFNGDLRAISNLTINSPKADYIGFIGYNRGAIYGLTLSDISITADNNVGGIAGFSRDTTISENTITGNIVGSNYVGLAVGYNSADGVNTKLMSIIVQGNVVGVDYVGGIVGYNYTDYGDVFFSGINKGGSVIATGANVGRIAGAKTGSAATRHTYHSGISVNSVTVNGSTVSSYENDSLNGAGISNYSDLTANINLAESALDTYIGGDGESNGYYWDYNGNTLEQRRIADYPLTFTLAGAGTVGDPYLVSNYSELRQASQKLSSVIKLTADIDLTGQKFYMLGSYNYKFTGTFDGNEKMISNLTINSPNAPRIGFIGQNKGVVKGLNLANVNIVGGNYVGGITGFNDIATIKDVTVSGNVNGNNNIGLGIGYSSGDSSTVNAISIMVEGNVSGNDYVGGIVGYNYASYGTNNLSGINKGGVITSVGANIGRIAGYTSTSGATRFVYIYAAAISSITLNGNTVTSAVNTSKNGLDIVAGDLLVQSTYTNVNFNFTDEALDYIWFLNGTSAKFRNGTL